MPIYVLIDNAEGLFTNINSTFLVRPNILTRNLWFGDETTGADNSALIVQGTVIPANYNSGILVGGATRQFVIDLAETALVVGVHGINVRGDLVRIFNAGTIGVTGSDDRGSGILVEEMAASTRIVNTESGLVTGMYAGVMSSGTDFRLTNDGEIAATDHGIFCGELSDLTLANHGTIDADYAILATGDARIVNTGEIRASGNVAINIFGAGTIVNTGLIVGLVRLGDDGSTIDSSLGRIAGAISSGNGADVVRATALDDVVFTTGGDDQIFGLAGDDRLNGGLGRDTIEGGAGDDRITGDAHADRFVFAPGSGYDVILDWRDGEQIDVSAFGFRNFAAVDDGLEAARQGVRITLDDASAILLKGAALATVGVGDFIL